MAVCPAPLFPPPHRRIPPRKDRFDPAGRRSTVHHRPAHQRAPDPSPISPTDRKATTDVDPTVHPRVRVIVRPRRDHCNRDPTLSRTHHRSPDRHRLPTLPRTQRLHSPLVLTYHAPALANTASPSCTRLASTGSATHGSSHPNVHHIPHRPQHRPSPPRVRRPADHPWLHRVDRRICRPIHIRMAARPLPHTPARTLDTNRMHRDPIPVGHSPISPPAGASNTVTSPHAPSTSQSTQPADRGPPPSLRHEWP